MGNFSLPSASSHHGTNEDHEGDEGQGCFWHYRQSGSSGNHRGQEDWHLHHPRPLQDQDSRQACHQGRNQAHVWKGGQGQGPSSQGCCEGFPSCCTQGSDLSILQVTQV